MGNQFHVDGYCVAGSGHGRVPEIANRGAKGPAMGKIVHASVKAIWVLLLISIVFAAAAARGQMSEVDPQGCRSQPEDEAISQLLGDTLVHGRSYEYDEYLSDRIGARLTGSPSFTQSVRWTSDQFKQLGLSNVHTEDWTIPATWAPEVSAIGAISSPLTHRLHIYSIGWSPSTPQLGISGNVMYAASLQSDALENQRDAMHGAVVLLDRESFGSERRLDFLLDGFRLLRSFGPAAILVPGDTDGTESATTLNFTGDIDSVPEAELGLEDVNLIRRLLRRGEVKVHFSFENKVARNVPVSNVVADIPGCDLPNQIIIVAAHLDSWDPGTGAQDDGTGVASLIEVARTMRALHLQARRTIRFVLFGGEEQGLLGSRAYVMRHRQSLAEIVGVLVTDTGAEEARGWNVIGRTDEEGILRNAQPFLRGLGADGVTSDPELLFQTDLAPFEANGVPVFLLWNDMSQYSQVHHKASDTLDSVSYSALSQNTAVIGITAFLIANAGGALPPHLDSDGVRTVFAAAGQQREFEYFKSHRLLP
jgi:carboxypeptidase Q